MLHAQRTTNRMLLCAEQNISIPKSYTITVIEKQSPSQNRRKPTLSIPPTMKLSTPYPLLFSLNLYTLALTATIPPSTPLSLITINNTLGLNATLLSLSKYPLPHPPHPSQTKTAHHSTLTLPPQSSPPPSDLPDPYTFTPKLPPGHGPATIRIQIQGYGAADMDPQALLVAFDKARVETGFDRDLATKMEERRVVYRSKG